jgi:hypothetical protein
MDRVLDEQNAASRSPNISTGSICLHGDSTARGQVMRASYEATACFDALS